MLSLKTEAGLKEAWRLIGRHAGRKSLADRIARVCPSIRLLGSGPFGWLELKRLVEPLGMNAGKWEDSPRAGGVVLVGNFNWTESQLVECVMSFRGRRLRMTCQQELVYELLLVTEPGFVEPSHAEEIAQLRAEHGALRWIGARFGWSQVANCMVPSELVDVEAPCAEPAEPDRRSGWKYLPESSDAVMPEEGVLNASGYRVGRSGLPRNERYQALRAVMEEPLPRGFHPDYAVQWGEPMTRVRLMKTANTLAANARNARKRAASMDRAIEHWESDLKWLRQEYGELARGLPWPVTEIW
jgi:hypothetical protein